MLTSDFCVALVCMPFCAADLPSTQIGLLTAIAEQAGFATDSYHLNLELAARIPDVYQGLCRNRGHMTGEWLFSVAAFGENAPRDDEAYFTAFPDEVTWIENQGKDIAYLSHLRHEVLPAYIEDCLTMVNWGRYQVIGFTSTFQQNVASLALARRIKERYPGVKIVFGGANMEDEMGLEYVRAFPFIDYAVVGEGDVVFPTLLRCLAANEPTDKLRGLVRRTPEGIVFSGQAPPVRNLDALPTPNYDEYFERMRRLGLHQQPQYTALLPFESSRGCWWGQKHHCTFCGLNDHSIAYRSKRPERVLAEISELVRRYRISFFVTTDNILDMRYIKSLFSAIQETKTDYQFYYEAKANLTHKQIRALYQGGVRMIQPGIESLSTRVLQLMRKGSTMLQNVRLLKWCRYYNIHVKWNLLWGFPGETEEDYRQELEVLRLISHLEPPIGCDRIRLMRFSPYFQDRETFPVSDVRPEASYSYVYPAHVRLGKVAYFFDYTMDDTVAAEVHRETQAWVQEWQQQWQSDRRHTLSYRRTLDALLVDDNRGPARRATHKFYGASALAYEFCSETMRTVSQVAEHLQVVSGGHRFPEAEVQAVLEEFCRRGLMLSEDGRYLSLALPANPNW